MSPNCCYPHCMMGGSGCDRELECISKDNLEENGEEINDADRLNFMFQKQRYINTNPKEQTYFLVWMEDGIWTCQTNDYKNPRDAIDSAMKDFK